MRTDHVRPINPTPYKVTQCLTHCTLYTALYNHAHQRSGSLYIP